MREIEKALKVMKGKEFVQVATADKAGKPNSALKLLLKIDEGCEITPRGAIKRESSR